MDQSPPKPSKSKMMLVAIGLALTGLFMLLHGLGIVNADWFRPNPLTPLWVFCAIGAILILSGILAAAQAISVPTRAVNIIGYSAIALAMIVAHWLVFFSEDARCTVATDNIFFAVNSLICRGFAGLSLAVFDFIFILIAATSIWRKREL
jgi:hypothetical protein